MADLVALKAELDTDPLGRGYSALSDADAASDLNLVNRPNVVSINEIFKYMSLDETYSTDGSDTQARSLWQRLLEVVSLAEVPTAALSNPWGSTAIGNITEIQQIKCHQLVQYLSLSVQGGGQSNPTVDLKDSKFQNFLNGAENAGCMSVAQKNALLALADNLQSRVQEIPLNFLVTPARVGQARALP